MLQDMNARPWTILKRARSLAGLHVKINKQSITGLPSYKEGLRYAIGETPYLNEDLRNKTLALLDTLPDGQRLCHGDFHPGNVILTKDGPIVIDWMTARAGSPWMDVARTSLLLSIGPKGAGKLVSPIIKIAIRLYYRAYLNRYHTLVSDTKNELKHWIPVIAAARLNEDIVPEREALIEMVKEGLNP
jgi:thiamine kinase-like enzyme